MANVTPGMFTSVPPDLLNEWISQSQAKIASMASSISSADGTSVNLRALADQRRILEAMQTALNIQLGNGSRTRRTRRFSLAAYPQSRRWMRP